ncbi:acetyl esterase/lipase [Mariniflexile fucanivorans]|uniref:Acetyl esterase/lipase n=1 Tax=Mariniflexile fucanivorans TaxID=264023 RepID=A0A4R1RPP3_9FLAO|nr:alpha/beta hydrolase [Mariniflexile fucanivorans]TCL67910.1 acetyl esterase/lipase [Mariniflexile fucanivorans]
MKYIVVIIFLSFASPFLAQTKTTYTYNIKEKDTLKLDVYRPENIEVNTKLPTLLWMHGGGFSIGSRDYVDDAQLCGAVTKFGYIGISVSYRLLRTGSETQFSCLCPKVDKIETFKQATIDYLDAAAFVVENAEMLNVDTTKIIAGGSSAGAEGILNSVYMKPYFVDNLNKYEDVKFAGVLSFAGAVVNASYITKANALPSVLFHGTADQLVPFASAPHHLCDPEKPGYLMLDGSKIIAEKLDAFETSYYFKIVKGGMHEVAKIPMDELDEIFEFFEKTVLNSEVVQTKIIKTKTL